MTARTMRLPPAAGQDAPPQRGRLLRGTLGPMERSVKITPIITKCYPTQQCDPFHKPLLFTKSPPERRSSSPTTPTRTVILEKLK